MPGGRPRSEITIDVQRIICTLIEAGDSDRRITKITKLQPRQWRAKADEDKSFATLLKKAYDRRDGLLASELRKTMLLQIKKGYPWWAKLAIHNYNVLLKDPDVVSAAKIKKLLAGATFESPIQQILREYPQMARAQVAPPPGTDPSVGIEDSIQGNPVGAPERKDGDIQTPTNP